MTAVIVTETEADAPARSPLDQLWTAGEATYQRILQHPFLTGLTTGELRADQFGYYVVQDSLYLRQYARALSVLAARAPDQATTAMFASHAASAVAIEQAMHAEFLADLDLAGGVGAGGVGAGGVGAGEPSPTTLAYTSYLLAVTHNGSFAEGLAAVLPCYWIYWKVGVALLGESSPNPLYARWIQTYAGEEFTTVVRAVLGLTDRIGRNVRPAERDRMIRHYRTATRYEWMFWDAAYRQETWPV